jgi:hypothetical protein
MAGPAILKIEIVADASRAVRGMKDVNSAAEKSGGGAKKMQRSFGSVAKSAAKVAGMAALGGLAVVLKTGAGEQKDFLAGQAQLANGLKTTGNAANTSVKDMEGLASSIQNYSGQTDDSIVASEKLMLTFTGVRNAAGKNNDIFDQSIKMTADMAAKMGGDASKYAVQLGKALNDPAKGVSKLTKIGVTFNDQQKKQIAAMSKAGDAAGAQKIILAELQKEFGGSAKAAGDTLPGQMQRAQRSFEDISQQLVASLMPIITKLADFLTHNLLPIFSKVMGFVSEHSTVFLILASVIGAVVAAVKVWNIVQAILNSTMLANPVFLIVAAIVVLVALLVVAWTRCETFRKVVLSVFNAIKVAANAVATAVVTAFRAVIRAFVNAYTWIRNIFTKILNWLLHSPIAAVILGPWRIVMGALNALVKGGIAGVLRYFGGLISGLGRILSAVFRTVTGPFKTAFDWVWTKFKWLRDALAGVWDSISRGFSSAISSVKGVWNAFARFWNAIEVKIGPWKLPGPIPDIPGMTIGLPDLPQFASGAYVTSATLAVVGEGRSGEFVTPEPMLRRLIREEMTGGASITVNGALDPDAVARQIEGLLLARQRRTRGVIRVGASALGT